MRANPTTTRTPHDWLVTIKYRNQKGIERCKTVGVAPVISADDEWHVTDEVHAIAKALRSIPWGWFQHFTGQGFRIPLTEVPDAILDVRARRRHEVYQDSTHVAKLDYHIELAKKWARKVA